MSAATAVKPVDLAKLAAKLAPYATDFAYESGPVSKRALIEALSVYLLLEDLLEEGEITFPEFLAVGAGNSSLDREKQAAARAVRAYGQAQALAPEPGDTPLGTLETAFSKIIHHSEFSDTRHRATVMAVLNERWDGIAGWQK